MITSPIGSKRSVNARRLRALDLASACEGRTLGKMAPTAMDSFCSVAVPHVSLLGSPKDGRPYDRHFIGQYGGTLAGAGLLVPTSVTVNRS